MEERIHLAAPSGLHDVRDVHDVGVEVPVAGAEHDGLETLPARRASGAALLVLALRAAGAVAGVVVTGLLTRQLGPRGFGQLSLILSVAMLVSTVAELGTTYVTVAEMAARPGRRGELSAGFVALRAVAGCVMAAAGGIVLVLLLHGPDESADLAAVAVMASVPLAAISGLTVLHQARLRPEIPAGLSLGQSLLWLVAVILAGTFEAPLSFYGLAFLVTGLVQAASSWLTVRGEVLWWSRSGSAARSILSRSWPLGVATVLGAVYYRLDAVLVFRLAGSTAAGFYLAAYRFLDVLQLAPIALVSVLLPLLSRTWARGNREGFESILCLAITVAAGIALPVAAGGIVAGGRVAVAVLGAEFRPAGDALAVLLLAFVSIATGYVYAAMLVAVGQVRVLAVVAALAAFASVTADLLVIPVWGAVGAAWVTVGVEYFVSSSLAVWIARHVGLRFPWGRIRAAVAASVVLGVVAWAPRTAPLPVLLGVPAAAYLAAAGLLGAVTRADLRRLAHPTLALGAAAEGTG